MIRIMLGLVLFIELVSTAFAFKINNGRLIEHREWTTGSAVLRVKESALKEQVAPAKLMFKDLKNNNGTENKDGILLHNKVYNEGIPGTAGMDTALSGYVNAYIENFNSSTAKTYKFYSYFCAAESCAISSYEISLDPGGYFELNMKRNVNFKFDAPGYFNVFLSSMVDSDDLTNNFATYDRGYVEIVE